MTLPNSPDRRARSGCVPSEALISTRSVAAIRRALLSWYDRNRRSLPWRRDQPDPYHIWVAEIMLQQTQVVSVLPYWKRFIKRFPSLRRLASAAVQDVLELWSGLGYYRRAHFLHAAARRVVAEHAGRIPRDVETLMSLPGIGRYTAGAISSIAFGRRAPLVDGNVQRVLQRLFHPHASQASPRGAVSGVWRLAERLVPPGRPGDFNQALMELGALICLPASPRCDACPLARRCGALIARMHDAGIWHADLQLRNILITAEGPYLIDFDGAKRMGRVPPLQRARNLLRLRRSLQKNGVSASIYNAVLEGYGGPPPPAWLTAVYALKGVCTDRIFGKR